MTFLFRSLGKLPAARKWQLVLELGRVASFLSKKYYGVGTKVEALLPSKYLDLQVLVILPLLNVVFCLRLSAFQPFAKR